ncbi:MAG: hypothetical protein Q4B26_13465, partial [Eubacteriales bacterium]|nr:hypothetical protein [Eubacteriales bacterium]
EHYRSIEEAADSRMNAAETTKAQWEARMQNAENEIAEKRAAAKLELLKMKVQEVQKTKQQCEKLLEEARASGEIEKEKLIREARQEIEKLTVRAMERLADTSGNNALDTFRQEQ